MLISQTGSSSEFSAQRPPPAETERIATRTSIPSSQLVRKVRVLSFSVDIINLNDLVASYRLDIARLASLS